MIGIRFYRNRKWEREIIKKIFSVFKFNPCECGCTKDSGIGINLWFFGINFYRKGDSNDTDCIK